MTGVAIVTGGAGGIGLAIVDRLVDAGYDVVAADIQTASHPSDAVHPCGVDVRDDASVAAAVDAAVELGTLRAVVNCAGVLRETPVGATANGDLHDLIDINLGGTMRVCRHAVPHLDAGSAIVNISSIAAARGSAPAVSGYAATKGGVESYTRALACELGPRGIRVNAVAPGFVLAPMSELMRTGGEDKMVRQVPLRRLAEPAEIAEAVEFLVSDRASYINGVVLPVDGGVMAR